jgi:hypothetical protein
VAARAPRAARARRCDLGLGGADPIRRDLGRVAARDGSGADFLPLGGIGDFGLDNAGGGLDSLAAILGQLDYCACSHCRSVLSPAAYLADLLGFLDDRPALTQVNALGLLRTRQPHIEHILLDCTNTHTELPSIDLVNELLGGGLGPSSYQTTATADELRMHPEHVDAEVYVDSPLSNRVHPVADVRGDGRYPVVGRLKRTPELVRVIRRVSDDDRGLGLAHAEHFSRDLERVGCEQIQQLRPRDTELAQVHARLEHR